MSFRIKKIILIVLISISTHVSSNEFEITDDGVFSNSEHEIITSTIKSPKAILYDIYFSYDSRFGNLLVFEDNSQYKKICYIPVGESLQLSIKNITCFFKYLYDGYSVWEGKTFYAIGEVNLRNITNEDILNIASSQKFELLSKALGKVNKKDLIFNDLKYKYDAKLIDISYKFKMYSDGEPIFSKDTMELTIDIKGEKLDLYKFPRENGISKMYLVKGDKVKILKDKLDDKGIKWYFINYKGKKEINMWIKADSIVLN